VSDINKQQQLRIKILFALGKEKGYLTSTDIADSLTEDIFESKNIEDVVLMLSENGISVLETSSQKKKEVIHSSSALFSEARLRELDVKDEG